MYRKAAVELVKKYTVDCIYSSAKVEGLKVTFPDTYQILNDIPTGAKPTDITFIFNMRNAWKFLLDSLDTPVNLMFIRELNKICGVSLIYGSGTLRESDVRITGTTYVPTIPLYAEVVENLDRINKIVDPTECALHMFEYLARSQLFIDGNKRVAQMVANKILVSAGVGILMIPDMHIVEFGEALVKYYETVDNSLYTYLNDNCIIKAQDVKIVEYKGMNYTVNEIVRALPKSIVEGYTTEEECAQDYVQMYVEEIINGI